MNLNWATIKIYLTPPLTPPFPIGGVKSFDELTDGSTNGSVKSFDQLIDNLWFLLKMMLDGVEKKNGDYWQQSHHRTVLARSTHPSNSS
jgi:hypothetical protein